MHRRSIASAYAERLYAALVYPMLTLHALFNLKCAMITRTYENGPQYPHMPYSNFPIGLGVSSNNAMARERRSKSPPYWADHPSNVELGMVAAGARGTALADAIAAHVCGCASCRAFRGDSMEHIGGFFRNDLPPTPLAYRSLAGAMTQLDSGTNGGKQNHP